MILNSFISWQCILMDGIREAIGFFFLVIVVLFIGLLYFGYIKFRKYRHNIKRKKNLKYHECLNAPQYIMWRNEVLKEIYGEDMFLNVAGTKYPVYSLTFDKEYCDKDIDSVCNLSEWHQDHRNGCDGVRCVDKYNNVQMKSVENLDIRISGTSKEISKKRKYYKEYKKIISSGIKRPKLVGFMLDDFDINDDNKISRINLKLGTYEQNVYTSHILEYELYKAYTILKDKDYNWDMLWEQLPYRKYIHQGMAPKQALMNGSRRLSLFSVQAIIVFKNHWGDEVCTFFKKRSENYKEVVTKLGHYQILPAGGFELCEDEKSTNIDVIKENCSLTKALFREYLEEIFNYRDFQGEEDRRSALIKLISKLFKRLFEKKILYIDNSEEEVTQKYAEAIMRQKEVKYIINLLHNKKAEFKMLGVDIDLVTLRPMVNFMILIEDEDYWSRNFVLNTEFKHNGECIRSLKSVDEIFKKYPNCITPDTAALYYQYKQKQEQDSSMKREYSVM